VPSLLRAAITLAVGSLTVLAGPGAFADGMAEASAEEIDPDLVDPHAGTPRPLAPDLLAGSVLVSGRFAPIIPSGSMTVGVAAPDLSGVGLDASGSLGLGLTRYVSLDAVGGYGTLPSTSRCPSCDGSSFRIGLGFTYHLVQALAFKPRLRYAVAFRQTEIQTNDPLQGSLRDFVPGSYQGLDLAQLSLAGLFYPLESVGVGPFVEMDLGTYIGRPDGARSNAVYAFFQLGVELTFEPSTWFGAGETVARSAGRVPLQLSAARPIPSL
jgi:hypothetical protein